MDSCDELISPGTTRFQRKPESCSYLAGHPTSSLRGLSDPDAESNESKSSLAVEGRDLSTVGSEIPFMYGRYGSDEDDNPWGMTPLRWSAEILGDEYSRGSRRRMEAGMGSRGSREYSISFTGEVQEAEVNANSKSKSQSLQD